MDMIFSCHGRRRQILTRINAIGSREFGYEIPAINAIRTSSERLFARILVMTCAR